jgi:hypothetical protein
MKKTLLLDISLLLTTKFITFGDIETNNIFK